MSTQKKKASRRRARPTRPTIHDTPLWCLDGARACPPDDVGGMGGYEQLLEVLRDKKHPEHKQMMAWAGGPIDPEAFDCRAVDGELTRWVLSQE